MASHNRHAPIIEAGLSDECERCVEISQRPTVHLDPEHLGSLWERMHMVKLGHGSESYRSNAERDACEYLYRYYVDTERMREAGLGGQH